MNRREVVWGWSPIRGSATLSWCWVRRIGGTVGSHTVDEELLRQIKILAPDQKQQVLDFALALGSERPRGTPGWRLADFKAHISRDDLDVMASEIEAACEQVRPDEW